jgi:hypothetical protein
VQVKREDLLTLFLIPLILIRRDKSDTCAKPERVENEAARGVYIFYERSTAI